MTREQRLEAVVRQYRAVLMTDIERLRAQANHGTLRQCSGLTRARKLWALREEREGWLATCDAALASAEALELVAPGTPDPRD